MLDLSWLFILVASSYFMLSVMKQRRVPKSEAKNLPPSPPKLPVISHLHLLWGGLPQHVLRSISQKHGPVAHVQLGDVYSVVLSSAEAARQAMKVLDPNFADRFDNIGSRIIWYDNDDIIFSPYNEHWRQMRKIYVSELLSPKNVRSFGLIRQDETARLIRLLEASGACRSTSRRRCRR